jgi:hypothetical protein
MIDTAITPLVEGEWLSIGTAPATIGAYDGMLLVVCAAEQPSPATVGFTVSSAGAALPISVSGPLWAGALTPGAQAVVQQ